RFLQGTFNGRLKLNDTRPDVSCEGAGGVSALRTLDKVVLVGMGDGSVRTVSVDLSHTTWMAVLTPNGGEVLGADWSQSRIINRPGARSAKTGKDQKEEEEDRSRREEVDSKQQAGEALDAPPACCFFFLTLALSSLSGLGAPGALAVGDSQLTP